MKASLDGTITKAVFDPLCKIGFERVKDWTLINNAAFKGMQDQLVTLWHTRQKYGASQFAIFKGFLDTLGESEDWVTGKSPWHKMKYMPSILAASDSVRWPESTEFKRKYPRLGIEWNPDSYNMTAIKDRLTQEDKEIKITVPERDIKPGQIIFYTGHIALIFRM